MCEFVWIKGVGAPSLGLKEEGKRGKWGLAGEESGTRKKVGREEVFFLEIFLPSSK